MTNPIETLKRIDLVQFLSQNYGLQFRFTGNEYVSRSPFTQDKNPSFFVRKADDGHWLFKCFSSGHGGSIIDFVQIRENLENIRDIIEFIDGRINSPVLCKNGYDAANGRVEDAGGEGARRSYDVLHLYQIIRKNDVTKSREYLIGRGISKRVVNELVADDILLHNRHSGLSYCCFAVRSAGGELMCLDNHQVDGEGKFVLGNKSPFSQDWDLLPESEEVFICESIIDYLSIKTLESSPLPGLALIGNQVNFEPDLLGNARTIFAALDDDRGGYSAILDIQDQFPDREIQMYDLEGHKDPNELLMSVRSGKGRKLSPERKLQLYREFQRSSNRAELARKWGIDRSHMYEIVRECDKTLLDTFSNRGPGRKPVGKPSSLEDAWQRIKDLEERYERSSTEREQLYCRNEFLKLRLKWAGIELATQRGEPVDERKGPKKKPHVKKKEKCETLQLIDKLKDECARLTGQQIMRQCCFSRTQIYQWRNGHIERKKRKPKQFPEETIENASSVVADYPHFSGRKGQFYMIYHRLGYISMNAYDDVKKDVKLVLIQELATRKVTKSSGKYYEHIKPEKVGEIWAEDFTELTVCGHTFKLAILIDVFDQFKLGVAVGKRATASFVAKPVKQALAANGGLGPEQFLLSDNGKQSVSDEHNRMLEISEIVHKCIPYCKPQYNGWVECEIKEFKNVFYNVWERRERNHTDKEKNLLQRVESSVNETAKLLNEVVPRPSLGGVTPADVHFDRHLAKKEENRKYYEVERKRKDDTPWTRKYWDVLKAGTESTKMTAKELMIKLAFFVQKPLRRIAKLNKEGVGL